MIMNIVTRDSRVLSSTVKAVYTMSDVNISFTFAFNN